MPTILFPCQHSPEPPRDSSFPVNGDFFFHKANYSNKKLFKAEQEKWNLTPAIHFL
jgi:hypothetical protein